jgi:glutaredoxin 3
MNQLIKYTVFSSPTCHYCHALMDWLTQRNIAFEERDIMSDLDARRLMVEKSQQMHVPVSIIELQNGAGQKMERVVVGFDQAQIGKILGV